ncbi:hypothetical protein K5X82_00040 [Halosquirtibacter xylanolyticus]|uniref:hypothetical protein n=1 Tax=Halosquirtibacter xylanolyticus TaxID=3374599 RepID=UPI00374851FA|nr:hypothetical protein K5X82_00040 [Prolixibacteraceae bacterium]
MMNIATIFGGIILLILSIVKYKIRNRKAVTRQEEVVELKEMFDFLKQQYDLLTPAMYSAHLEKIDSSSQRRILTQLTPDDPILLIYECLENTKETDSSIVCLTTRGEVLGYLRKDNESLNHLAERIKNREILLYATFFKFDNEKDDAIVNFALIETPKV